MTGRASGEFTPSVGRKFHPDGRPRRFPGNSLICPLPGDAPQVAALERVMARFRAGSFARRFAELPASSHHMTVFDLVCDPIRRPERWSSRLPLDQDLAEVDAAFRRWLTAVEPWPTVLRMQFDDVGPSDVTLHLRVSPADDATGDALAAFREAASAATGVRHPVHDRYRFHLSLAYQLAWMDRKERRAFDAFAGGVEAELGREFGVLVFGAPQLVLFDDMFAFPTRRSGTGGT